MLCVIIGPAGQINQVKTPPFGSEEISLTPRQCTRAQLCCIATAKLHELKFGLLPTRQIWPPVTFSCFQT